MEAPRLLQDFLILFLIASAVLWLFHRLRLPSITGFLVVGALVGPYGQGWVKELEAVQILAEIGVVLLLFTIGAEFSIRKLISMRRHTFGGGLLQVGLTVGLVMLTAPTFLETSLRENFVLGCLIALSSTAVVMRQLAARGETAGPAGRAALGMLIFQDLCVVPMMLAFSVLSGQAETDWKEVLFSLGVLAFLLVSARLLIPRMLAEAAKSRSHEMFVFMVGLVILGAAWLSALAGLSLALGAFVAGIVVADNEYSHQVLTEVLPFRESFIGIFFTSVGMLVDLNILWREFGQIVIWVLLIVVGKVAMVLLASLILRYSWHVALRTAFTLAQIGEFSFVLAGVALSQRLMSPEHYQVLVASTVVSMLISPLMLWLGTNLSEWYRHARGPGVLFGGQSEDAVHQEADRLEGHVIIVGFGLNGRRLAASLRNVNIPAMALEIDPGRMHREGSPVPLLFGDASSAEVLDAAGLERALALVVAVSDLQSTQRILHTAKTLAPEVPVIVRTRHLADVADLYRLGAREVVVEEVEASLEILLHLLSLGGLEEREIRSAIQPYLKHPLRRPRPLQAKRRAAPLAPEGPLHPPPENEFRE